IDDFDRRVARGASSILVPRLWWVHVRAIFRRNPLSQADAGRRKAAVHEAHVAETCAVTLARAATPVADMEAMRAGGAAPAGAQTVNQNSTLVEHYSEPNPSQNREVARAAACNAAGAR